MRTGWTCLALAAVMAGGASCHDNACDSSLVGVSASDLPLQAAGTPGTGSDGFAVRWGGQVAGEVPYFTCFFDCHFQQDGSTLCQPCAPEKAADPHLLGPPYDWESPSCEAGGKEICHVWTRNDRVVGVDLRCQYEP